MLQYLIRGGKRQVVELDDFKRTTGTLEEIEARKAELERIFPDKNRREYEIGVVK